jgi:hypothetical protein
MVHELSVRTGVCGDQRGRVIWAAILWRREDAPEPPQFPVGYESAIRDEAVGLARRFPNVLTWFGPWTLQWWALGFHSKWPASSTPDTSLDAVPP